MGACCCCLLSTSNLSSCLLAASRSGATAAAIGSPGNLAAQPIGGTAPTAAASGGGAATAAGSSDAAMERSSTDEESRRCAVSVGRSAEVEAEAWAEARPLLLLAMASCGRETDEEAHSRDSLLDAGPVKKKEPDRDDRQGNKEPLPLSSKVDERKAAPFQPVISPALLNFFFLSCLANLSCHR